MSNESKYELEETDQIKQGNTEVGPMVIGAIVIVTLICISYSIIE